MKDMKLHTTPTSPIFIFFASALALFRKHLPIIDTEYLKKAKKVAVFDEKCIILRYTFTFCVHIYFLLKIGLMKKTHLLILLSMWLLPQYIFAEPIGSAQALRNAQDFLHTKNILFTPKGIRRAPMADVPGEEAPYYVFNLGGNGGFVIASGDDRAFPVLAYSDKGSLATDSLPDNVSYWLNFYKTQIKALKSTETASPKPRRAPSTVVQPLLTSRWDQGTPYNLTCPLHSSGRRCLTGCVATAMAQVMYYHRKNSAHQVMEDIPGYDDPRKIMEPMEYVPKGSVIDWDNMIDDYTGNYSEEQAMAVANLMLYCGTSVYMMYGPDVSVAYTSDVPEALIKYFDYDDGATYEDRQNYTDESWENKIYDELAMGHPILYSGNNYSSGHAFVIDGCDAEGFVHVNWGWGGDEDGYFALTSSYDEVLNGFSNGHEAVFGVVPNGAFPRLTTQDLTLKSAATIEGLSSLTSLPVSFTMILANLTGQKNSFEHAIGLYKNKELQSVVATLDDIIDLAANASKTVNVTLNQDASLANGAYQLRPISRKKGASKWRWNGNYDQFLTLAIHDDKADITVGKPPVEGDIITFDDHVVNQLCVENWDTNGDGELSKQEAAAVKSLNGVFKYNHEITSFDELQYFTGLTAIEKDEFRYCYKLTSFIIPSQVVSIGENAFQKTKPSQITIPVSVQEIGRNAFSGISGLEDIRVEEGNAFYDSRNNCHALIETASNTLLKGCHNTIIPNGIKSIGEGAFDGCDRLTSISIPKTVLEIGPTAFRDCMHLQTINFPEALTTIGEKAFSSCEALTSITIPKNVQTIYGSSFNYCKSLKSIQVDTANPYFDSRDGCNAVMEKSTNKLVVGCQTTVIPSNTESIGDYAFSGCENLLSVTIPTNVTSIGQDAFSGCGKLANVELPEGLRIIGANAFSCNNVITTIILPSTITAIGDYAFFSCDNLVTVEAKMTNPVDISYFTFGIDCEEITLYVPIGSASSYQSADNWNNFKEIVEGSIPYRDIIYFADSRTKAMCINQWDKNGDRILTKEEAAAVTDLGDVFTAPLPDDIGIFVDYYDYPVYFDELQYFTGLTTIGNSAFIYSEELKSVTLPPTITEIGIDAFMGCKRLQSLELPNSVTSIGDGAFCDCQSLTSMTIPEGVTKIESSTFGGCENLVSIKLPESITSIGSYAFDGCSKLENLAIPEQVRDIGRSAFANCTGLKSVSIPSQVETIGENTFNGCNMLTSVEVKRPEPLTITENTFSNYADATLYVPKGSRSAYMAADNWKLFGKIVEMSGIKGDVNNDSKVSVADVMQLVNYILGKTKSIPQTASDMNEDSHISVTDVMKIVNIIFHQ